MNCWSLSYKSLWSSTNSSQGASYNSLKIWDIIIASLLLLSVEQP